MKIIINLDILNTQIQECDIKAVNASTEDERGIFDGIANLLSNIAFALENGDDVRLEVETTK